jgi:hypothetical protein
VIKDHEAGRHQLGGRGMAALIKALQKAGAVLIFEDDAGGPGVRLKKQQGD